MRAVKTPTASREPHPCLGQGCGHPDTDHIRVRELEGPSQMVAWCAGCRRHEIWNARRLGSAQELQVVLARALLTGRFKSAAPRRGRSHSPTAIEFWPQAPDGAPSPGGEAGLEGAPSLWPPQAQPIAARPRGHRHTVEGPREFIAPRLSARVELHGVEDDLYRRLMAERRRQRGGYYGPVGGARAGSDDLRRNRRDRRRASAS